jgi:hypothetical protein
MCGLDGFVHFLIAIRRFSMRRIHGPPCIYPYLPKYGYLRLSAGPTGKDDVLTRDGCGGSDCA